MGQQRVRHGLVTEQQQMNNVFARKPCSQTGNTNVKKKKKDTLVNPITQAFFKPKTQWPEQVTCPVRLAGLYFRSS